jgi:hypothetical protein
MANDGPIRRRTEHGAKQEPPALARHGAASKIGSGFRERLGESLDSTTKVLTVVAGAGALFIGAGYLVEWQRFKQGDLPSEEVLPLIPKDQIAAAGVRELVISVLFILVTLGLLGFVLVRLARAAQQRTGRTARFANTILSSDVGFPTAVIGVLTLLLVPFDSGGIVVAAILTGLLYYGLRLIREFVELGDGSRFPLWRLALAVGVAAFVLSVARQAEFPERRPDVVLLLVDNERVVGEYLASDSSKVLLRQKPPKTAWQCDLDKTFCQQECHGDPICIRDCRLERQRCNRPRLLVVPAGEIARVQVTKYPALLRQDSSLLDRLLDPIAPGFELRCIPPECRWDEQTRIGPSSFL